MMNVCFGLFMGTSANSNILWILLLLSGFQIVYICKIIVIELAFFIFKLSINSPQCIYKYFFFSLYIILLIVKKKNKMKKKKNKLVLQCILFQYLRIAIKAYFSLENFFYFL